MNEKGEKGFWDDAEVISIYTRAQAILDGVLVPVSDLTTDEPTFARSHGFVAHTALTSALADLVIPSEQERDSYYQDVKGRLSDVLNMARIYGTKARRDADAAGEAEASWRFPCIFRVAGREGYRTRAGARLNTSRTFHLRATISPGDDGQPVVTIGFPEDF